MEIFLFVTFLILCAVVGLIADDVAKENNAKLAHANRIIEASTKN